VQEMARKALETAETLAKVFFDRLLPGENPAVFQSSHLALQLYRQQMGDPIPQDMEINGCQFLLPSDLKLDGSSEILDRNVGQINIYLVYKTFLFFLLTPSPLLKLLCCQ